MLRGLGEGGSGLVMLARHKSSEETFAMKIIQISGNNEHKQAQINREIALQARCKNCPNVVRFKEYFQCEDKHCIVMEHMEGGDL